MDEPAIRSAAEAFGDALVDGNVDRAIEHLSDELKRNLGEVVALLPLPATDVEIASIERTASAIVVVLRVTSETAVDELQTRWKDRGGTPRIVEISHLQHVEREAPLAGTEVSEGTEGVEATPVD